MEALAVLDDMLSSFAGLLTELVVGPDQLSQSLKVVSYAPSSRLLALVC